MNYRNLDFNTGVCTLCSTMDLTAGDHSYGGIRFCQVCIQFMPSFKELAPEVQAVTLYFFKDLMFNDSVISKFEEWEDIDPEVFDVIAQKESEIRVLIQDIKDLYKP